MGNAKIFWHEAPKGRKKGKVTSELGMGAGFEEIMMINQSVIMSLEGQNVIRFVIRFDYTYLGKVGNVASLFQRLRLALGQNKVTICTFY